MKFETLEKPALAVASGKPATTGGKRAVAGGKRAVAGGKPAVGKGKNRRDCNDRETVRFKELFWYIPCT